MCTATKECFKCGDEKPLHDFYAHPSMSDGHVNKCKECNKADVTKNRDNKIEYYRDYDRRRGNRQDSKYLSAYRRDNPEKYRAHRAVANALKEGKLTKPVLCSSCGSNSRLEGHHHNYGLPLNVSWFCSPCHRRQHRRTK